MTLLLKISQTCNFLIGKPKYSSLRITSKRLQSVKVKAVDINTNVAKDVILFKYDNPSFYKTLSLFSICQFGFWSYLSFFAYNNLRDAPVEKDETVWWKKVNLGDNKFRNGLTILSFMIGWGCLAVAWTYTLRSIRYLILRKGGQDITIVTYTPFGPNRMFTLGLENVSCVANRKSGNSLIPLKVKGHLFYYVLDSKGEFRNPTLFDHTAGLSRKLNK